MMLTSPIPNQVSSLTIPETPRTESSSQMNQLASTTKRHRSSKTQMKEDVTLSMDSAHLSTPIKNKGIRK